MKAGYITDNLTKCLRIYKATALVVLNAGVLLLLLNLMLWFYYRISDHLAGADEIRIIRQYGITQVLKAYPGRDEGSLRRLLGETWTRPFVFEPFTMFGERPAAGDFVNVSRDGFRLTPPQGTWPPSDSNFNIFMFGGSTTFGYGVADDETMAAHLQRELARKTSRPVCLYNFGRGQYFSTQERILFEHLLTKGTRPDLAIFVDGLNDVYYAVDIPYRAAEISRFVFEGKPDWDRLLKPVPMGRLALSLYKKFFAKSDSAGSIGDGITPNNLKLQVANRSERSRTVVNRYLQNMKLIEAAATAFGVRTLFVWQPVAAYKYDLTNHPLIGSGIQNADYFQDGYDYFAKLLKINSLTSNFLWDADMQPSLGRDILYVDKFHYSAHMHAAIAKTIADYATKRGLIGTVRPTTMP